jgi:Cu/Ag efflux pump CusA
MIGGISVATLLTLLFLPALYVAWYRVREPKQNKDDDLPKAAAAAP